MAVVKRQKAVSKAVSGVPTGVKVISVLYYIGAVLSVLFGILFIIGAGAIGSVAEQIPGLALAGAGLFVVVGIIFIALAVLGFFIGKGLWKAQNWARIVAIVFAVLGVLMALSSLVQGIIGSSIIGLITNGLIGGYLLFNQNAKAAFA